MVVAEKNWHHHAGCPTSRFFRDVGSPRSPLTPPRPSGAAAPSIGRCRCGLRACWAGSGPRPVAATRCPSRSARCEIHRLTTKFLSSPLRPPKSPNPLKNISKYILKKLGVVIWVILLFLKVGLRKRSSQGCNRHKPLVAFCFASKLNSSRLEAQQEPESAQDWLTGKLATENSTTEQKPAPNPRRMNTLPIKSLDSIL